MFFCLVSLPLGHDYALIQIGAEFSSANAIFAEDIKCITLGPRFLGKPRSGSSLGFKTDLSFGYRRVGQFEVSSIQP